MNKVTYKLHYLACPYTHADKTVMKERFKKVTDVAVELLKQNVFVFSPISYNAPWEDYELPHIFSFWEHFDKAFVERSDSVIVLKLEGWEKSVGVREEIKYAQGLGLPIYYVDWEQVENGQLANMLKGEQ